MPDDTQTETPTTPQPSPLEEAKQLLERLEKVKAEQKAEADRLDALKADQLLSGTAGLRPDMSPKKPLTNKEYKDYIEKHGRPPE